MPVVKIPFEEVKVPSTHTAKSCSQCNSLPEALREQAMEHEHFARYMHMIPTEEFGWPEYVTELNRKMGENRTPNYIYPVGKATFQHVYPDTADARNWLIPIEPVVGRDYRPLMEEVEDRLIDVVHKYQQPAGPDEQRELLMIALMDVINVNGHSWMVEYEGKAEKAAAKKKAKDGKEETKNPTIRKNGGKAKGKVKLNAEEAEAMRYLLLRDKIGMGIIEPLILDNNIEDISCSGLGCIFIEHKTFKALKAAIMFEEFEDLDAFLRRNSERINKPVTYRKPIVDATLPDGSRINIVFGNEVSKRGSNFTIRKFSPTPLSVMDIISSGGADYKMIAYLSIMIEEGMNMWVSGETASGKTTLLNAITTFISPDAKIVTVEDTPEVQIPHPNWLREVVRGAAGEGASVTMFDLLKAALRQRPNEIIVGEIRGEEGNIAFQAMQTGHAVMATFHAATVEKLIQRVTASPINVPKSYMDNLNIVIIASAVKLANGKLARRILSINELFGYDSVTDSFSFAEVFHWDPVTDTHEFTGYMNSYLLENKVAVKRGIPATQRRVIYQDLERRARVLQKLHQQGITHFNELYKVIIKAKGQKLF
jgi:flagellar protein FlaI